MTRVAVLGGGVAGLTAAHELAERGFEVAVSKRAAIPAARRAACRCPGSGTGGRADLPAEHGFRFFPGFYRHLPTRCGGSPSGGRHGVFDSLVGADADPARAGRRRATSSSPPRTRPSRSTTSPSLSRFLFDG